MARINIEKRTEEDVEKMNTIEKAILEVELKKLEERMLSRLASLYGESLDFPDSPGPLPIRDPLKISEASSWAARWVVEVGTDIRLSELYGPFTSHSHALKFINETRDLGVLGKTVFIKRIGAAI